MKFTTGYAVDIELREKAGGDLQIVLPRDSCTLTPEDRDGLVKYVRTSTDLRSNVAAFHAATGIKDPDRPCVPADDVVRLRARMLVEELFETLRSMFDVTPSSYVPSRFVEAERTLVDLINRSMIRVSLPDYADGLADLMYIAEGGFLAFGIDSRPVHAEVQRANMAKVGGPVREDGKRLKPPGWTPPDIAGIIKRQQEGK